MTASAGVTRRWGILLVSAFVVGGCEADPSDPAALAGSVSVWRSVGPDFGTGDVSRDGRYFSDINWSTGDLDLVDLQTGEVRPLTGRGYEADRYAWASSFSPDGSLLAVAWYDYSTGSHELRVEAFDGSSSRVLVPADPAVVYVDPLDWTEDQEHIVIATRRIEGPWEIVLVSEEDGEQRTIRRLDWEAPGGAHPQAYPRGSLSPDGESFAFDYPSGEPGHRQDVYAVDLETGEMSLLVAGPAHDRFVAWASNGQAVFFYSDRDGEPRVWRQPLRNRAPDGDPRVVSDVIRAMQPIAMTERGIAYGVPDGTHNVFLATLDLERGGFIREPTPVDRTPWVRNALGDWSPDGSRFMYISFGFLPDPSEHAVFVSPEGETLGRVPFPHDWHNKSGKVTWIDDEFVLVDGELRGRAHLHAFDPATGTISPLPDYGPIGLFSLTEASPDGSELYVVIRSGGTRVVAFDRETAERRVVARIDLIPASLSASPNGAALAFLANDDERGPSLEVLSLDGARRQVEVPFDGRLALPVSWTPEGDRILVGLLAASGDAGIVSIPLTGDSEAVFISLPEAVDEYVRVGPAGRFAFQGGVAYGSLYTLDVR